MEDRTIETACSLLRFGLGISTFLAGADKFTNLLADWEEYIAPQASDTLPISNTNFMRLGGIVEMAVGAGMLSRHTRPFSYVASAWLMAIAGNLVLNGDYDIAVRDVNLGLAAFVLGKLSARREQMTAELPRIKAA